MRKNTKRLLAGVLTGLALTGCSAAPPQASKQAYLSFLGTRDDADCILLRSGASSVMIDTGEAVDSDHMLAWLEEQNVTRLDCLILTHPDKDHIGGVPALLEQVEVAQALQPDYRGENERNDQMQQLLREKGVPTMRVQTELELEYGELSVRVLPPQKETYKGENNYSLAAVVTHGQVEMVFTGDAQKKRTKELLEQQLPSGADLLKLPHHGRANSQSAALIQHTQPQIAVVTASEAEEEVAQALAEAGAEVYYSRGEDLYFVSDGSSLTLTEQKPLEAQSDQAA